jgi:hypothetical protein
MISFNFDAPLKVKKDILRIVSEMEDVGDPAFAALCRSYRGMVNAEIAAADAAANDSDGSSDDPSVTGNDPAAPDPVADETGGGANPLAGVFHEATVSKNGDVFVPVITGGASGKNMQKPGFADFLNSLRLHCLAVDNLVSEILANGNEALRSLHVRHVCYSGPRIGTMEKLGDLYGKLDGAAATTLALPTAPRWPRSRRWRRKRWASFTGPRPSCEARSIHTSCGSARTSPPGGARPTR